MYNTNSVRIEYYRHRNEQKNDSYDDDFKGFCKEAEEKEDFPVEEKKRKNLLNFLLG